MGPALVTQADHAPFATPMSAIGPHPLRHLACLLLGLLDSIQAGFSSFDTS